MITNAIRWLGVFALLIVAATGARAETDCVPPSPAEVGQTMNTGWHAERFTELDSYASALVGRLPGYVPAEIANSFAAYIVRGDVLGARSRLDAVLAYVGTRPGDEGFQGRVQVARDRLQAIITQLTAQGQTFPLPASPAVMKQMFDELYPPTVLPNAPPPILDLISGAPAEFIGDSGGSPSATITSPTDGSDVTAGGDLSVNVSVVGGGVPICTVRLVEGSTVLAEDTTAPFTMTWQAVPAGSHTVRARVTDYRSRTVESPAVHITAE